MKSYPEKNGNLSDLDLQLPILVSIQLNLTIYRTNGFIIYLYLFKHCLKQIERSLQNLNFILIDLMLLHNIPAIFKILVRGNQLIIFAKNNDIRPNL